MAENLTPLLGKVDDLEGMPQGTLTADEFNTLVRAVIANQNPVKKIIYNNQELPMGSDGIVRINPISSDSRLQIATSDNTDSIVSISGQVVLHLKVTSVANNSDTFENVVLDIQRFNEATGWTSVGSARMAAVAEGSSAFTPVDISACLISGDQQIRVRATGEDTNLTSIISFQSIVFTKLTLEFAGEWHRACRGQMPLSYYINGAVAKTLHISISGQTAAGTPSTRTLTYALGTSTYPTTPWSTTVEDTVSEACKVLGVHGVHSVEAWLTCDNGNGGELESNHAHNQIMVVTDEDDSTPYLMLQEVAENVQNYVQTRLLDFAVYNPSGSTKVAFSYKNYTGASEYLRIEMNVDSETSQSLINTIEVEDSSQSSLFAYLHVFRVLPDNSEVDFMLASVGTSAVAVTVDNSENFTPVTGADFVLNPKTRNNTESNPARILNAARNNMELPGAVFNGFSFVNDGWCEDDDNNKILRVRAGQTLTIPYECFQDFLVSTANSCTIEIDFAVRNITNEDDPIFRICSYVAATGKPLGIEMKPLVGKFLTTSKTTDGEQDFGWGEGIRTHIMFNIVHALRASADDPTPLPLVRVFMNGVIVREFLFDLTEPREFVNGDSLGIRIGQEGAGGRASAADIDIYSIRVYRKALGNADCLQNYISSLPTSAEKIKIRRSNDILSPSGTISYSKASAQYNCLLWHGRHTSGHSDADKNTKYGWLEISQLDASGRYDPNHSGTICRQTGTLPNDGQGSTAKTYYEWNQQYKLDKASGKIVVDGEEVPDGWVDGNGVYRGARYQLMDGVPFATKLVIKANYASAMQSHKMAATDMFNELHRIIVGPTSIQQTPGFENSRVAVIQKAFLYFTQGDNDPEPVFQGVCTFGPGKMDKPTWGYDDSVFPDFAMLEGSDNNMPLTDMRVPWTDDTVTYNPDEEYFEYAGMGNLDFDAGKTNKITVSGKEVKVPKTDTYLPYFKNAWNWLFMHNCLFRPFDGTLTDFLASTTVDIRLQYWMTRSGGGAQQYDLYRYHVTGYDDDSNEIGTWVPAGMPSGNSYGTKNLLSMFPDAIPVAHSGQWDLINADFQAAMAASAKLEFGGYFDERSAQFHYSFVNHFIAGSDNNSKNTYYVLDPIRHVIEMHQDDLDTIFRTDNVGWQSKPYYIDREHDWDENGTTYYEGKYNVLFDLVERMYAAELPQMLNQILAAMSSLITSADMSKGIEASPMGAMQKYFFAIQEYFPAVSYNETARIRYEQAQLAVEKGSFTPSRGVQPITQSLGDQLQAEKHYWKRRMVYMSSYAAYGEFSQSGSNALSFQGYPNKDGGSCVMRFQVTPHQWLYPTGSRGQTLIDPHVRVAPGETYTLNLGTVTGDTNVRVAGINYMRSLGNMGNISVNPAYSFPLSGERLTEFIAEPTEDSQFRPSSMVVTAPLMERFSIKGSSEIGGTINLTSCTRLREVDLRDTSINTVRLPESERLESVRLPHLLSTVNIDNAPNLSQLTLEGYGFLTSLVIGGNVGTLDTLSVLVGCYEANAPLATISIKNVNWQQVTGEVLQYLLDIENTSITGNVSTREFGNLPTVTFGMKCNLIKKFGNVDDVNSPDYRGLHLTYAVRDITTIGISGEAYTHEAPKVYQYTAAPPNAYQNGFQRMSWSVTNPAYGAECSIDPVTGALDVQRLSVLADTVTISAIFMRLDGTPLIATKQVGIYDRPAALGDYVFADGSYSDADDPQKTVVGVCFYLGNEGNGDYRPDKQQRLMVATDDVYGTGIDNNNEQEIFRALQWGLYYNNGTNDQYEVPFDSTKYSLMNAPSYNMYDLQSIINLTSSGSSGTVTNENYVDENEPDGFAKFPTDRAWGDGFCYQGTQSDNEMTVQIQARTLDEELASLAGNGYQAGDVVNSGYAKTLKIIAHRNRILSDPNFSWVGTIPQAHDGTSELQDLFNGMAEVRRYARDVMHEEYTAKWSQFFYPAASACYAYQPSVKPGEILADKFKAHNWFLPTIGHQTRLFWYAKLAPAEQNVLAKAFNSGRLASFTSTYFWSCTENVQNYAWCIGFSSGSTYTSSKYGTYYCRAVAAF